VSNSINTSSTSERDTPYWVRRTCAVSTTVTKLHDDEPDAFRVVGALGGPLSWSAMASAVPDHVTAAARRLGLQPDQLPGGEHVLRGRIPVPEDRRKPGGRTIELNVVVAPSRDPEPRLPPQFDLAGGPGRPSTAGAPFLAGEPGARFTALTDIVMVDQRGTGGSNPLLCDIGLYRSDPFAPEYPTEEVAACRDALLERADLTCYGTADHVADLEAVRQRLGCEQVDIFSISYGTRAALAWMRAHPESVRSAVLSGVLPPTTRLREMDAPNSQRALDDLLSECEADADCRAAFPDLRARFADFLTRLHEQPTEVELADGRRVEARPGGFMAVVRHLLYGPTARALPHALDSIVKGDWTPFLALGNPVGSTSEPAETRLAEGLYLSILCSEDLPHFDVAAAREAAARTWFGTERLDQALSAAQVWPRGDAPAWLREYPRGDQPILVINGGRDYVTPPAAGDELARKMPNVHQATIRHMGHSLPDGLSHQERFDELCLHFMQHQSLDGFPLDSLDEMTPPPFKVA
jgi:pimeloyl-ACP methyl ester carboxylesterase